LRDKAKEILTMSNKNYLTYEEFGAKGDGVADDMAAIVACHE
jgi:hypothetical protein